MRERERESDRGRGKGLLIKRIMSDRGGNVHTRNIIGRINTGSDPRVCALFELGQSLYNRRWCAIIIVTTNHCAA